MAEPYAIKMPQLSDTMTEGVIVTWEKQVGDKIKRGDIVATVETDKAVMDVEVFRDGYLSGPMAAVDAAVAVGAPIAYIVEAIEEVSRDEVLGPRGGQEEVSASAEPTPSLAPSTSAPAPAIQPPPGALYSVVMPQLSDTMTEGVVVTWEKQPGDRITRGTVVATVETDKAVMDVEVFKEGYLSGPFTPVDATVAVGDPMAYLVETVEQVSRDEVLGPRGEQKKVPAAAAPAPTLAPGTSSLAPGVAPRPTGRGATPLARKLAGQQGVDLDSVAGSGPQGVIVARDVAGARPAPVVGGGFPQVDVPGNGRRMSGFEAAISKSMTESLSMPTFHVTAHIRLDALIKASKAAGVSVTVTIAKACAVAMQKHPKMNWCYQPVDKLVERSNVDVGMAVAADGGGLVVPVLRGCESRDLAELNDDWKDLVGRARKRRLKPEEYTGSTFQISNMGMFGVSHFDAIATPGIAAILAISANAEQGSPFTITADHRVVNGADVAMYLGDLKQLIEWSGDSGRRLGLRRRRYRRRSRWRGLRARSGRARPESRADQRFAVARRRVPVARLYPIQGLARRGRPHPRPRARRAPRRHRHRPAQARVGQTGGAPPQRAGDARRHGAEDRQGRENRLPAGLRQFRR